MDQKNYTVKGAVGLDEVGRGALAGPLISCAVVLDPDRRIVGLKDSKVLSHSRRLLLKEEIEEKAVAWGIGSASVKEIDQLNVLQATFLSMRRAYASLDVDVDVAYVDGNMDPQLGCRTITVVSGDKKVPAISAASIMAKVFRDLYMVSLSNQYPDYDFAKNKGYGTSNHLTAIEKFGILPVHRRSFSPIKNKVAFKRNVGSK